MPDLRPLDRAAIERRLRTRRIGRRLILLDSVPSTQDVARAEAEAGAEEGVAVLAEEQTAGRGRLERTWVSPKSANLHCTIVVRPHIDMLRKLSMLAALAAVRAYDAACGLHTHIKWPNDVVVHGRKVAGMLIDNELEGESVRYALVGAGLNCNFDPSAYPEIADIATSPARELGHPVEREAVLAEFLNAFEELYLAPGDIGRAWRAHLVTLGQDVRVTFPGGSEEGLAEDVDDEGSLVIRRRDGSSAVVPAGEVTLRR